MWFCIAQQGGEMYVFYSNINEPSFYEAPVGQIAHHVPTQESTAKECYELILNITITTNALRPFYEAPVGQKKTGRLIPFLLRFYTSRNINSNIIIL